MAETPGLAVFVRLVEHSSDADPQHLVAACTHCRALHEIAIVEPTHERSVA